PVPVFRVSTPFFAPDGNAFGIIIINLDLRTAFARIRSSARLGGSLYLVNERGDYLVHPDRSREFGFEFGRSYRIQDDFPVFSKGWRKGEWGAAVIENSRGERYGIASETVRLAGGLPVTMIEAVRYSELVAAVAAVRDSSLIVGLLAVLGATVLAVLIARSL